MRREAYSEVRNYSRIYGTTQFSDFVFSAELHVYESCHI